MSTPRNPRNLPAKAIDDLTDITRYDEPKYVGFMIRRDPNLGVITNVPHYCVHHSPTGYEFGFGGSGPADLALNMVEYMLVQENWKESTVSLWKGKCFDTSWRLHQETKWYWIASIRHDIVIPYQDFRDWIMDRI